MHTLTSWVLVPAQSQHSPLFFMFKSLGISPKDSPSASKELQGSLGPPEKHKHKRGSAKLLGGSTCSGQTRKPSAMQYGKASFRFQGGLESRKDTMRRSSFRSNDTPTRVRGPMPNSLHGLPTSPTLRGDSYHRRITRAEVSLLILHPSLNRVCFCIPTTMRCRGSYLAPMRIDVDLLI